MIAASSPSYRRRRYGIGLLPVFAFLLSAPWLLATELTFQNGLHDYHAAESTTLHGAGEKKASSSYGTAPVLGVAGVKHGGFQQLGLLRFNEIVGNGPGQIPQGAEIVAARLELYKVDEPHNSRLYEAVPEAHREIRAFKMLTDWKAGLENNAPEPGSSCFAYRFYDAENPTFWGDANVMEEGPVRNIDFQFLPRATAPLQPESGPIWMAWDVTDFVEEWVKDPASNHGIFLNALSYYVGAFFASCHHDDPALRPRLIVVYQ